jgi:hypothetical protein
MGFHPKSIPQRLKPIRFSRHVCGTAVPFQSGSCRSEMAALID